MTRQAYSLDVLLAEVNDHAPTRSKASDGGIGDVRHQHEKSDHNPNAAGVWRAYDVTNDQTHGLSGTDLATRLAKLLGKHPAMMSGAYVIWNRRIISYDRRGEGWRNYTGSDAHTGHVHLSVATSAAGYDSRKPWQLWAQPPTRVTKARELMTDAAALLELAAAHAGPARRAACKAAAATIRNLLKMLPRN